MTSPSAKKILLFLVVFLASTALIAEDIPLRNWEVPPYTRSSGSSTGLRTMTDNTPGTTFTGVNPFRLVDTREAGFPAGYGTPIMAAGVPRNFDLNSRPGFPAAQIPAGVEAYSLNVTVTNTAGPGFILMYPQGGAVPSVSSLNYVAGQTVANAVIVPAGTGGGVTAVAGVSGTDLIIDINGYFTDEHNTGQAVLVFGTSVPGFFPGSMLLVSDAATAVAFSNWTISSSTAAGSAAVFGLMAGGATANTGVWGSNGSIAMGASGVRGQDGSGAPDDSALFPSGVRGLSIDYSGVHGVVETGGVSGVRGTLVTTAGAQTTNGYLGSQFGVDPGSGAAPWGVFAGGDIGASGTKHFVEPHPTDPTKVIKYASLEGAEAGTYFRGRSRFERGVARISVPDDFRMVTDPEGLTVQITPIGAMATVGVLKVDLDEIVVQSSRNVEFSYLVQGVRSTFKHIQPIATDGVFVPESAESKMPLWLSPGQKRLLIQNGTYKADGTVNMETAQRLGWDKFWERRKNPTRRPAPAGAAWDGVTIPTAPDGRPGSR